MYTLRINYSIEYNKNMKKIIFTLFMSLFLVSCGNEISQTQQPEDNNETPINILALWDSLTAGYNLDISDSYPAQLENKLQENNYNYKIINAWVSWDTSQNLLDRIDLYSDTTADIYLLTIWWNDALRRMSVENLKNNIQTIIDTIYQQNPDAKVVLSGMQIPINYWLNYSKNFKEIYESLAEENDVYFYEFFLEDVAQKSDLNLSDGIHPNAKGYEIIAQNLYNFLEDEKIILK